jgi:DNA-binding NarL/FixJ family response regulator
MTTMTSREPLLSSGIERETGRRRQIGQALSIVLIDRQRLTREFFSRWLQDASPDLQIVSVVGPVDLLDASRSLSEPHTIIFSVGAASVRDPDLLGKITLCCSRTATTSMTSSGPWSRTCGGYTPTSLEPAEAMAALQCVAAGGAYVPASALIKFAQDRQHGAGHHRSSMRQVRSNVSRRARANGRGAPASGQAEQINAYELA